MSAAGARAVVPSIGRLTAEQRYALDTLLRTLDSVARIEAAEPRDVAFRSGLLGAVLDDWKRFAAEVTR